MDKAYTQSQNFLVFPHCSVLHDLFLSPYTLLQWSEPGSICVEYGYTHATIFHKYSYMYVLMNTHNSWSCAAVELYIHDNN